MLTLINILVDFFFFKTDMELWYVDVKQMLIFTVIGIVCQEAQRGNQKVETIPDKKKKKN